MTVRTHHDEIGIDRVSLFQNFIDNRAGRFVQGRFYAGLLDFLLPFGQLRLVTFLGKRLRARIDYRHWHQLRHPRNSVAHRSRRRGRTDFPDVNEMNLRRERFCDLPRKIDNSRARGRAINRHENAFHKAIL